jgi:hypothetical protein
MTDPQPPQTGGQPVSGLFIALALLAMAAVVILVLVLTSGILA